MRMTTLCIVLASCACAQSEFPRAVQSFAEKRDQCDHFRGEVPDSPDDERMSEVNQAIDRFCTGTDQQLSRLKKKYAGDTRVSAKLDAYEPTIEAKP